MLIDERLDHRRDLLLLRARELWRMLKESAAFFPLARRRASSTFAPVKSPPSLGAYTYYVYNLRL